MQMPDIWRECMNKRTGISLVYSHGAGQNVRVKRLPKAGETLRAISWDMDCDGAKGTNIAVGLLRLGVDAALIAHTGDDVFSSLASSWIEKEGGSSSFILRDPAMRTMTGVVFVDDEGRNSIVLSDGDDTVPREWIDNGLAARKNDRIFITGFEISHEDALYAMRAARGYGMYTIVNPSPVPDGFWGDFSDADLVVVNETEAMQLSGAAQVEKWERIAESIRSRYCCRNLIITLGKNGYLLDENGIISCESEVEAPVVDTSGAGDGFLLAVAYGLFIGKDLRSSCCWANHYAAISVGIRGTIPSYLDLPSVEMKIRELEENNIEKEEL